MITKRDELRPLLKYPGGKSSELKTITEMLPDSIENYVEPFVGGGAVYFSIKANGKYYLNDISHELIMLYKYVASGNKTFFDELGIIIGNWNNLTNIASMETLLDLYNEYKVDDNIDLKYWLNNIISDKILEGPMFNIRDRVNFKDYLNICLCSKFKLIKKNEIKKNEDLNNNDLQQNIEAGIKASYYTYLRDVYNQSVEYKKLSEPRRVAVYLFIREYCYSSMFRFNKNGEFNVPYGGVSYNKKSLEIKLKYYKTKKLREHLNYSEFYDDDFETFLRGLNLQENDFMFLDPPYDTTFSDYDKNQFTKFDQERLADYLINRCSCKFMLVIKKTDFISRLYENQPHLHIREEAKNYFVSFKNRNEKAATHLIITNY